MIEKTIWVCNSDDERVQTTNCPKKAILHRKETPKVPVLFYIIIGLAKNYLSK